MASAPLLVVEGASDRVALETLAARLGRDLVAEGVEIVELGGITNLRRFLVETLPARRGLNLRGLYDVPEERYVRSALEAAGLGAVEDRWRLEELGFFACEEDLEDELLRAVGGRVMLQLLEVHGDLASFRRLQHQPALRAWDQHRQFRRFLSARSGNKARYARILADAVELDAVPSPLWEVLAL
ncbi:TOPRIM nucleotidyl transferase/hydrolase domain-containing protein [Nocardioides sp.]|uniref:TOPRIM nucleotidyl transferase/hydrolase domain-containing protein n=1 Tax=Nocardioides sp. TaxID=35761 RepID=UPI0035169EE3